MTSRLAKFLASAQPVSEKEPSTPGQSGKSAVHLAFAAALALGVAVRVVEFFNCRSLGLDEARLAVNIASRSFTGLLSPLDLEQSAPPLFLWGERLVTLLLGHSDCALRLLPVAAGIAAALLMYPFASRFLDSAESRLAAMIGIFCPLLITYSNALKQYSVELLMAIVLLLVCDRALTKDLDRRSAAILLATGALAPWLSLTSVFVLSACWLALAARVVRGESGAGRAVALSSAVWGLSLGAAYLSVYRAASQHPYLNRFWELAFVVPTRPGFLGRLWKTIEDLVWGFVAGDPLVDRRPFLVLLHVGTVLVLILCSVGAVRVLRTRGAQAVWLLCGPLLAAFGASMVGVFPIAPRLILFLLPALIVLFVAGLGGALARFGVREPRGLAIVSAVLLLPLEFQAIVRTFALEPSGHFERLVRELREHRTPGEPVYVFARSMPAWIYYSTDWNAPDTLRLRFLIQAASAGSPGFENSPSRGRVREQDANALAWSSGKSVELLGLASGMEWRENEEHVRLEPDSGWVEVESRRIEGAATPGIWVLATTYYAPESDLFKALERAAARRTFAHLRGGSALVRYEFVSDSSTSRSQEVEAR
jgi:dolichyl-phosphate-mannose-protein mannosyltransferase